jgi:predicted nucleic acid-binding protein
MSELVIFDTSIPVDALRTGGHQERVRSITGLIRTSSLVLAELWRGATKAGEREFLRTLARNHPILTPTENNWRDAAEILAKIHLAHGFASSKLHDLHFDVLIALTARSPGAWLITTKRIDFEMIHRFRKVRLEIW